MATTNKAFKVKNGLDLQAYDTTISATAIDVFVYDTSKDSDGGAWRHRTQNTSWYNETLNTSTRGSRREFPAVAVIVVEVNSITIYDGDDPSLPLWWSYVGSTANSGRSPFYLNTLGDGFGASVTALNGSIILGVPYGNTNGGFRKFDFIADRMKRYTQSSTAYTNGSIWPMTAIGTQPSQDDGENLSIVNYTVNDVAMTVLPNAPINSATGLPIPTIAVATDGGVSVVKDDGTVVDITGATSYSVSSDVSFTEDNRIAYTLDNNGSTFCYRIDDIPSSDFVATTTVYVKSNSLVMSYNENGPASLSDFYTIPTTNEASRCLFQDKAIGTTPGLTIPDVDYTYTYGSQMAFITSSYNSGWQNRSTKLATLSDTDATNVTGSELVTNGNFSSATGWTAQTGWSIDTGTGTASCDGTSGAFLYQTSGFPANTRITISFDITSYTSGSVRAGSTGVGPSSTFSSVGSHSVTFTTSSTDPAGVEMYSTGGGFVGTIDNVSARIIEEDRSVHDNGLQVFGTVTKSAVATSADLVAYSGWSASNYLEQPYNADLQFGTGDFCFTYWVKFSSVTSQSLYSTVATGTASGTEGVAANTNGAGALGFAVYNSGIQAGGRTNCGFTYTPATTTWICVQNIRRNGVLELWVNGDLKNTAANTDDINDTNSFLRVGNWSSGVAGGSSSLALFRSSATAPSSEQIKKIYEDEKFLFQEGSQATLYGSSDAVTALAYDDDTNLLHVGTSGGRSVFQGLRRVDNTTTAVGAAISASNGLVADE